MGRVLALAAGLMLGFVCTASIQVELGVNEQLPRLAIVYFALSAAELGAGAWLLRVRRGAGSRSRTFRERPWW
jgi:hypothetical protein